MNELEYRVAVANNAARVGNDGLAELRDQAAELGLKIELRGELPEVPGELPVER